MSAEAPSWSRYVHDGRLPGRPVDEPTAALLERITCSPENTPDVATVCEAVAHTARDHGGAVDLNRLRERLWNPVHGAYMVTPQVIGATVSRLARSGALEVTGVGINEDRRGGNAGKPQRTYRLVGMPPPPPPPVPPVARRDMVDDPATEQERARQVELEQGTRPTRAEAEQDWTLGTGELW